MSATGQPFMSRFSGASVPAVWRLPLVVLGSCCGCILVLHAPTALSMAEVWNRSETYAHGWVVPPIVLWLMWRQRSALFATQPRPGWLAALPLALASALWLAGDMVSVNAATHLALVAMLVACVPLVLGWRAAWAWAFPLSFVFLAVPIGDFMLPQLMSWTADITVVALRASGIPVYREGLHFIIPSGSWSVVEACSGIRYLVASIMAGCLYGYLNYRSLGLRLKFLGLSIVVALVANWLRAYLIVMLGHHSGNTIATGVDHLIYGWVFFGIVLMALFWVGGRWSEPQAPEPVSRHGAADLATSALVPIGAPGLVAAALLAVVVAGGALLALAGFRQGVHTGVVALQMPQAQASWQPGDPPASWEPTYERPNASAHAGYRQAQDSLVGLHIAYFRQQGPQRKLISSTNVVATTDTDAPWARVSEGSVALRLGGQAVLARQHVLRATALGLTAEAPRLRLWQFFWVNGHLTASPMKAKLLGALEMARGHGDDGAIVTLYALDEGDAERVLEAFVQAHGEALLNALRATRGQD